MAARFWHWAYSVVGGRRVDDLRTVRLRPVPLPRAYSQNPDNRRRLCLSTPSPRLAFVCKRPSGRGGFE